MRKHIILAAIAALTSFTACSNEEEEQIPGAEVNFTINNTVTRATTDAAGLTTFKDNDKVYVYSKGLYTQEMQGVEFTVNGNSLNQNSGVTYRYNGTKGATFTAYHYYNTSISDGNITVGSDQSAVGSFQQYDLMTAQVTVSNPTETPINFDFKHRFSLVKVDVSEIENVGLEVSSVTINNVICTATWKSDDNSITVSGDAMSVKMGKFDSSSKEFWAIIPAQSISAQDLIEVVTSTNKVYTYTNTGSVTFEEGKMKKFTLSASGFNTVSATISASSWTEDTGVTGTADERILELITVDQGTFSENNNPTQITGISTSTITENKWYIVSPSSTHYECESENGSLKIVTDNKTWHQFYLCYRLNAETIKKSKSKLFTINIEGYSNQESNTQLRVGIMGIEKHDSNYPFFLIDGTNYGYQTATFPANSISKTFTYTVNFKQIDYTAKQGNNPSTWSNATEEDYTDAILHLAPLTASTWDANTSAFSSENSLYITKVTITEKVPEE